MSDVRKLIYGTLLGFMLMLVVWFAFIYLIGCGGSLSCEQAIPKPERTPIPTLIPATLPAPLEGETVAFREKCSIAAVNLLAAWVEAGFPENDPFMFTDVDGKSCQGTYAADITLVLNEGNVWYPGALACSSCHNADLSISAAKMDLSSYAGILAGSRRESADAQGNDILGNGSWEQSKMYEQLVTLKLMPLGRPPDMPENGPVVFVGTPVETP